MTVARVILLVHHVDAMLMLMGGLGRRSSARPRAEDADQSEHCHCKPDPTEHMDRVSPRQPTSKIGGDHFPPYPHTPDLTRAGQTCGNFAVKRHATSNGSIRRRRQA